jgi:divalent metal cation (Fe/Co/Zn/Cd) transporter
VPVLVDQHAVPAAAIQAAAERVNGVYSAYQIRSRGAPHLRFAEVTIAVNRGSSVEEAHRIADQVETLLRDELDLHEVVVHVEPC